MKKRIYILSIMMSIGFLNSTVAQKTKKETTAIYNSFRFVNGEKKWVPRPTYNTLADSIAIQYDTKGSIRNINNFYDYSYGNTTKNDLRIPIFQDGMVVSNGTEKHKGEISLPSSEVWMTFEDVVELIKKDNIFTSKIFKKIEISPFDIIVSNFYKGKAVVTYSKPVPIYEEDQIYILGHLTKDKTFKALKKPIQVPTIPIGITPDGYLVSLTKHEMEKSHVFDADLNELSKKTFIREIELPAKLADWKLFNTFPHPWYTDGNIWFNNLLDKEKWVMVGRSSKKQRQVRQQEYNFVNKDGDFLLDKWILKNEHFKRKFVNGLVTIPLNGGWVQMNDKGEITHEFEENITKATIFQFGKSIVESDKGIAVINKKNEILMPWNNDLKFKNLSSKEIPDFNNHFNKNGVAALYRRQGGQPVFIDTSFNVLYEMKFDGDVTYYNNEIFFTTTYKTEEIELTDYTKVVPKERESIPTNGYYQNDLKIWACFIPDEDGSYSLIDENQKEVFYIENRSHETKKITLQFTWVVSGIEHNKRYKITVPPNDVYLLKPGNELGIRVKSYKDKYKPRKSKVSLYWGL